MKKVLVVEDSQFIANAIALILKSEDIAVLTSSDGAKVAQIAKLNNIDLILLDIMMPGVDGYQVFESLKANKATREIPVIIVTAKTDALKWDSRLSTCDDFIPKPFEKSVLVAKVKKQLGL